MTKAKAQSLNIAELSELLNVSQKYIRHYLRSAHTRSVEQKNQRWGDAKNAYKLSAELTQSVIDRFTPKTEAS